MNDQGGKPAPEPMPQPAPVLTPPAPPARVDRWAHRRGEPRVFAFLWTLFLFAATATTFLAALTSGSSSPDVMRPATRMLLAVTITGIVVIWPMIRLSQSADRHPIGGVLQDLVVILIPVQAVIWPQWLGWLGRWPFEVIAAVSVLSIAWAMIAGSWLALAQASHLQTAMGTPPGTPVRWLAWRWMLVFVALATAGLVPALIATSAAASSTPQEPFRMSWMLSPAAAVYEITRDRAWTGVSAAVARGHWIGLVATALASIPCWVAALIRGRGPSPNAGLH